MSGVLCFAAAKFDCFNGNCSLKVVMMFLGRVVSPRFMLSSFQLGYNKCLKVYNIIQRKIYRCHDNKKQVKFNANQFYNSQFMTVLYLVLYFQLNAITYTQYKTVTDLKQLCELPHKYKHGPTCQYSYIMITVFV